MAKLVNGTWLELANPLVECPACHFASAVAGQWTVENGRLVFRADEDPLPRRGPDLFGCSEGHDCPLDPFDGLLTDSGIIITGTDLQALQQVARHVHWGDD